MDSVEYVEQDAISRTYAVQVRKDSTWGLHRISHRNKNVKQYKLLAINI